MKAKGPSTPKPSAAARPGAVTPNAGTTGTGTGTPGTGTPGRAHRFVVNSPELWELLVAPVRSEVGEALRIFGPCSVAEIAAALDRPADTLYRHIEALREAGFVRDAGFRKNGRHTEQLFDVVADDFVVEFKDSPGKQVSGKKASRKSGSGKGGTAEGRAIIQTAESFAKTILKAVKASAEAGELEFEDTTRNISINYELSWLTHEQFQEIRALIRRLKELMDAGKRRREGRLYMTLAIATPVTRKRGANARAAAQAAPAGDSPSARAKPRRPRRPRS